MIRKRALWLLLAIAILVVGFYLWGSTSTPSGQPPLVLLNEANVSPFQQSFNAASSNTRIVLLLSPT
ncbi:MAG TPA: hypothetical protein VN682_17850 [Terriglobales bacterium]|nr:hypothetical protein [Terriglobales bacterium]HXF14791.1 hypothetical protein [Terriglobales bacterium]